MTLFKLIITASLVLISGFISGQIPSHIPSNGLIAYWPLDSNTLNAASPSTHHGTATNAMIVSDRFGQPNSAYYLNGNNAYITLPFSAMSQISGSFSVAIWARSDTFVPSTNGHEIINDRSNGSWPYRFRIGYAYANNTVFHVDSAYFDRIAANGAIQKVGVPSPSFDGWEHYVYVYDMPTAATATINAYKNGQFIGSTPAASLVSGARNINIGRTFFPGSPSTGIGYFKGSVDEVCLWNRALTAAEIQNLFSTCILPIQSQPANQTTTPGGTANFSLTTGPSVVSFQWQIDSIGTGNWFTLSNGGTFSGTNSPVLTISGTQRNQNGWLFRCLMSDGTCNLFSNTVSLTVNCQNLFTSGPSTTSQPVGGQAIFQVSSSVPGIQYQWQTDIGNGFVNLQNLGQYSGTQSGTLIVNNLTSANNGQLFRCLATENGCEDTSAAATLNVNCSPLIITQPSDTSVRMQQHALFTVNSWSASANFQWYLNNGLGFTPVSNGGQYSGANSATLSVSNLQLSNNNTAFQCVVSEGNCADTSDIVILTVMNTASASIIEPITFQLYPNPAQTSVRVTFKAGMPGGWLEVYDALGKRLQSIWLNRGEQHHVLQVDDWAAGLYLLRFGGQQQRLLIAR